MCVGKPPSFLLLPLQIMGNRPTAYASNENNLETILFPPFPTDCPLLFKYSLKNIDLGHYFLLVS